MTNSFNDIALLNEHIKEYQEKDSDSSYLFLKEVAKRSPFPMTKNRARKVLEERGVRV
ncbi:hypothetical protein [Kiloniella majae]|uniref:hypothetical protein n=1 Tax=Kiloniella majae TaxID=1938558 RepID=UPI0015C509EA|nr:hypothetical protein [Kiloniella majae]